MKLPSINFNDATRAAFMSAVTSLVDFLVLIQLLHWTAMEVAGADLVIGNVVIFLMLLFKKGQQAGS